MTEYFKKKLLIAILIVTIIIDIMGLGIVFPIMPALFFGKTAVTFGQAGGEFQNWYYSIALAAWPLGIMLGGPILGELSDKYGRKKILIVALSFTCSSYLVSAFAILTKNYLMFIGSRFVSGLAGGAFEIAQATVIDISTEENKSRNLGFITMAASLGFVIGPVATSFAASMHISYTLPFLLAATLSLTNVLFIVFIMTKDLPKHPGLVVNVKSIYKTVSFLLSDKRVRIIGLAYLLMQCGWGFFGQGVALFLTEIYHYTVTQNGFFYALTGLSVALCSLFLQPILFKKYKIHSLYIISAIICGSNLFLTAVFSSIYLQWLIGIIASACQLICYTCLLTIISSSVSDKEQGKAMGAAGAGFGLAWFLNDLLMGHLSTISLYLPIPFGGGMFFVSILFVLFVIFKSKKVKS